MAGQLTTGEGSTYSVRMNGDLDQLEQKISQITQAYLELRTENAYLREALAAAETQNTRLQQKIEEASMRLEALLRQIPALAQIEQ